MAATCPDSAVELQHMRAHSGKEREFYKGWRTWECEQGDADALEAYLWVTKWSLTAAGPTLVPKRVVVLLHGKDTLTATDKPGSAVEQLKLRRYDSKDQRYYQGQQTWQCDQGAEDDLEAYLGSTTWTVLHKAFCGGLGNGYAAR